MKKTLVQTCILSSYKNFAQCSFKATLNAPEGTCLGDRLVAHTSHALSKIVWYKNGVIDSTVIGTQTYGNSVTVAGGNGAGNAANQLGYSYGVFVDENGNIFVADNDNNRIQEWAPGSSSGITVAGGNGAGSAANQLNGPSAVFVDKAGSIYIADAGNNRIQKWLPGSTSGITVAGGNGQGSNDNQFSGPSGVYVDCNGGVYVSDAFNARVQYWAPGAINGISVAGGNGVGLADNQLQTPSALCCWLDGQKNIYASQMLDAAVLRNGLPAQSMAPVSRVQRMQGWEQIN